MERGKASKGCGLRQMDLDKLEKQETEKIDKSRLKYKHGKKSRIRKIVRGGNT